jgi:copper(I)-binding protein
LRAVGALTLLVTASGVLAHQYYGPSLTIIHPWVDAMPAGTKQLVVRMRIEDISEDDRLIGAETPVAERVELVVLQQPGQEIPQPVGVDMPKGQIVVMGEGRAHLLLHGLKVDLLDGSEYEMNLEFEKAGWVEAGLVIAPNESGAD